MHSHALFALAAIAAGILVASVYQIINTWHQKPLPPPQPAPTPLWQTPITMPETQPTPPEKATPMSDETVLNALEDDIKSVVTGQPEAEATPAPAPVAAPTIITTVEADIDAFVKKIETIAAAIEKPLHPVWAEIVALAKKL